MQIVPAILEKTEQYFFTQISKLSPYFNTFQIDIADGEFVTNRTVQIEEIISARKQWNNDSMMQLMFDFHLMVNDYEKEIKKLIVLKNITSVTKVLIHYSLSPNLQMLSQKYPQFLFGLVLNAQDSVESFTKRYPDTNLPLIQIMTIDIGYQGLPFKPEVLQKIEQLRNLGYRSKIFIDGSVNDKTLPIILSQKYKPDILVVGSFLIRAENLKQQVEYLKKITEQTK